MKADNNNNPFGDKNPDYVKDEDDQDDNKYKDSKASEDNNKSLLQDLTFGLDAITQEMQMY
ncbi:hypothetical protein MMC22_005012 [Lobaria immixta]|nr:hypothetical protein [Lobaria immixta]